jgi:ABC-2 type transport system permease protein
MRIQAIFKRIMLQRRGDKRTLAMMFLMPAVLLTLMFFLFQTPSNLTFRVGIHSDNATLTAALKNEDKLNIIKVDNSSRTTMNDQKLDAIVAVGASKIDITYANQSLGTTQAVKLLVNQVIQTTTVKATQKQVESTLKELTQKLETMSAALSHGAPASATQATIQLPSSPTSSLNILSHSLYGDPSGTNAGFQDMAPVLVGAFVFFLVFLISGISLVNERSSGTLGRMLVTPVKRSEIVMGYTLSYGFLAIVQTIIMVAFAYGILGVHVNGNIGWVFVINFFIAIIALLFGLLFSTLANTEFQFVQMIPVAIVPQFLFSGLINVSTMPTVLQWIAHVMPVYYGITAMQLVVKRGVGFSGIWFDLLVMAMIAVVLYFINVLALKTMRRT